MKAPSFFLLFLFFIPATLFAQCLTSLPPPACTGTEPLVVNNETLNEGTTKWYYGSTTMMSRLTLNGGTLIVCGDLTIDQFYMDSGNIIIRPGGRFVIGSGVGLGLQFKGKCAIYNYGTCEVQRNLTLENGVTSSAKPNIVLNALKTSVFKMNNQYLVVNNNSSWFINNGQADLWGIITDNLAAAGSVCLGHTSSTRMAIMINKVANTYVVPTGNACVNVYQFSQFNASLTNNTGLLVCLGSGHTSCCTPNLWGAAQVFTACTACSSLTFLPVGFKNTTISRNANNTHKISWELNTPVNSGSLRLLRSVDGRTYNAIDSSLISSADHAINSFIDKRPLPGINYYMIKYTNPAGISTISKVVQLFNDPKNTFNIYPVPFDTKFSIDYPEGQLPEKIMLTDISGRNVSIRHTVKQSARRIDVIVSGKPEPGVYIVHILTNKKYMAQTIMKR